MPPKKKAAPQPPTEMYVIGFPDGEFKPLFVSSKDVERVVLGWSSKTAANLRSEKRGPSYYLVGGTPYYRISDLEEFFGKNEVKTMGNF